jgi:hypothetical protein
MLAGLGIGQLEFDVSYYHLNAVIQVDVEDQTIS